MALPSKGGVRFSLGGFIHKYYDRPNSCQDTI